MSKARKHTGSHQSTRTAFTLVELLVVIGIIAVLISILLPALSKARKAANSIKCSANIRSILQGMQLYAAQNRDAIPGSAWTTAQFLYTDLQNGTQNTAYGPNNCPNIVQVLDWATPIARIMGAKIEDGATAALRVARWEQLRNYPAYQCPENEFNTLPYSGSFPQFKTGKMFSYTAGLAWMLRRDTTGTGRGILVARSDIYNPPSSWNNHVSKVGDGSRKIFVADGARFSTCSTAPDSDISIYGTDGASFCDIGAGSRYSRSWDRGQAGGNTAQSPGPVDARLYAFRHGQIRPGSVGDTYRMNCGFFDGHVETLGDLQASNPNFWYPKGTELKIDSDEIQADVFKIYFNSKTYTMPASPYVVPY